MGMLDFLDRDNDGSAIDDVAQGAANLGGAAMMGLGGLAAGVGGIIMGGGLVADATVVGAPLGLTANMVGGGLMLGGGAVGTAGAAMMSSTGNAAAEELGDFTADLLGTRGPSPYAGQPNGDPHYAAGRQDGFGQQLHRLIAGPPAHTPAAPAHTPAPPARTH